jgi:hypothetical protein
MHYLSLYIYIYTVNLALDSTQELLQEHPEMLIDTTNKLTFAAIVAKILLSHFSHHSVLQGDDNSFPREIVESQRQSE